MLTTLILPYIVTKFLTRPYTNLNPIKTLLTRPGLTKCRFDLYEQYEFTFSKLVVIETNERAKCTKYIFEAACLRLLWIAP